MKNKIFIFITLVLVSALVCVFCSNLMVAAVKLPDGYVVCEEEGVDADVSGDYYGLLGDVDQNNAVNVIDATNIQLFVAKHIELDDKQMVLADVDLSGEVSITDATLIQAFSANLSNEYKINHMIYKPEDVDESTGDSTTTPATTPQDNTKPTEEDEINPDLNESDTLSFSQYGRYTGLFVEDGSDEYVKDVAVIKITNISNKYLAYSMVTFDISGEVGAFSVTGLNPGQSAWVLETNRLVIDTDAVFTYADDTTQFIDDNRELSKDFEVTMGDGTITVKNNTSADANDVYVYYKQRHTDSNFLGGITYRVSLGSIAKGESSTSTAGHCDPSVCEVVRIDWEG